MLSYAFQLALRGFRRNTVLTALAVALGGGNQKFVARCARDGKQVRGMCRATLGCGNEGAR